MWAVIFGSIGLGFFVYGKKRRVIMPIISGIVLMIFPYFVSNAYVFALTGVVFVALPFIVKR